MLLRLLLLGVILVHRGPVDAAYAPLTCNDNVDCSSPTPFSTIVDNPDDDGRVVVPCGQCFSVDYTDGTTIHLPSGLEVVGTLLFPPSSNVVLNTTSIIVQGKLSIDPPSDGNRVKVMLHGHEEVFLHPHDECNGGYDPTCPARVSVGKKPVVVAGGTLDVRGVDEACPSWTRLDRQLSDVSLKVDAAFASCVRVGDEMLVTSVGTSLWDDERGTVTSVDPVTGEIGLDSPIPRPLPALTGPGEPEYAVEVARLSRSVVFTALSDDPEGEHIGGHLMVFLTSEPQTVSGVHFDNFGQGGNLGRYPVHFHLCNDSNGSIVSKNVITNSNQRCVLIHGTNGVTVEDNAAWNTRGHCYATETGSEINNVFKNNLGSRTKLLQFHNTQSDSKGFWTGKHQAATFWVRNMNNEWIGNVAAGSESFGWWIEMGDLNGDQRTLGPVSSFRDNVAHSNKVVGFNTYKKGWKPTNGGVFDNLKIYKNPDIGFKFHITGNVRITNSLFADNGHHILSGVWNTRVTFENTVLDSLSQDLQQRLGRTCPNSTGKAAIKHAYNNDISKSTLALTDVTFKNNICGKDMFQFHNDSPRQGPRSMGAPVQVTGLTLVNVLENSKPHFNCDWAARDTFLEDVDGVLGPVGSAGVPGFIVRNQPHMLAFIPQESCSAMSYSGNDCSAFCEGVCLRQVAIKPVFDGQTYTNLQFLLTDGTNENTYSSSGYEDFRVVLPKGQFHGTFLDSTGVELIASSVEITAYQEPLCTDFVTASDFVFPTNEPTYTPTVSPTVSGAPTNVPDRIVRVNSASNDRYLWVRPDGGLKLNSDMAPLANTAIVLKKVECLTSGFHFDIGYLSPCYLIEWEHGRRLGAKNNQSWTSGVYATSSSTIWSDNYWFLLPQNGKTLIINAFNGRSLYDSSSSLKFGASPPVPSGGDLPENILVYSSYRWNLVDVDACPVPCFDTCVDIYGGTISSGITYMCAKGCAGMSSYQVSDPDKYCNLDPTTRYSTCVANCANASSSQSNIDACEVGCQFWNE